MPDGLKTSNHAAYSLHYHVMCICWSRRTLR